MKCYYTRGRNELPLLAVSLAAVAAEATTPTRSPVAHSCSWFVLLSGLKSCRYLLISHSGICKGNATLVDLHSALSTFPCQPPRRPRLGLPTRGLVRRRRRNLALQSGIQGLWQLHTRKPRNPKFLADRHTTAAVRRSADWVNTSRLTNCKLTFRFQITQGTPFTSTPMECNQRDPAARPSWSALTIPSICGQTHASCGNYATHETLDSIWCDFTRF